ncbi:MAG: hypothetical protein IJ523_11915, partial [Succinivibrionaceae bacterium]|nr:hypothetical protein [Succinivibrionaceae bacterium]
LFFKFDPCITFFGYFRVVDRVVACEVYWLVLCPSGEAVPGGVNSNSDLILVFMIVLKAAAKPLFLCPGKR